VSIRSAPSSHPARKYCDVSGLPALYTDPRTRLHFHSTAEYKKIQAQSTEVIKIMLELRGQTPTHQLMLR
jgi:INO80 complex subunit C